MVTDTFSQFFIVESKALELKREIESLKAHQFVSEEPIRLCNVFLKIVQALINATKDFREEWIKGEKNRNDIERKVRRIGDSIGAIYSFLRYVEASTPERTLHQMVVPLELLIEEVAPYSREDIILIRPQWKYNFGYFNLVKDIKELPGLENLEDINHLLPTHIPVISFPGLEKDNIFILAILSHEIGHFIDLAGDESISQSSEVRKAIKISDDKIKEWINLAQQELPESIPPLYKQMYLNNLINKRLSQKIPVWLCELAADIIGSRILGIAYLFSANEIFGFFKPSSESRYPPNERRLAEILKELSETGEEFPCSSFFKQYREKNPRICDAVTQKISEIVKKCKEKEKEKKKGKLNREEQMKQLELEIIEDSIYTPLNIIKTKIEEKIPSEKSFRLTEDVFDFVKLLENHIPPNMIWGSFKIADVRTILNAGWLYWIAKSEQILNKLSSNNELSEESYEIERRLTSRLLLRAVEVSHIHNRFLEDVGESGPYIIAKGRRKPPDNRKGVLTKDEILAYLEQPDLSKALVVTPLLDVNQIKGTSIDVRLGNVFIVTKRTKIAFLDPADLEREKIIQYQEKIYHEYGKSFILHPGEFVLGSTLEYISMPLDLMGYVVGKSSWGRLGLVIATATQIAPGFKGVITLELSNLGTTPIVLRVCNPIAQIVFHRVVTPTREAYVNYGKYPCPTEPEFSRIYENSEISALVHDS